MKKLLIFGASGLIGKELKQNSKSFNFSKIYTPTHKQCDLIDFDKTKAYIEKYKPDIIINAAGIADLNVSEAPRNFSYVMFVNAYAVENLAKISNSLNIPLIHISSDRVFDGAQVMPYEETDSTNPLNIYGMSKLLSEKLALRANKKTHILRTSTVFGVGRYNILTEMIDAARKNPFVQVIGDSYRCPTSAKNLANVVLTIAEQITQTPENEDFYGIFHYSGYPIISLYDLTKLVLKEAHKRKIIPTKAKVISINSDEVNLPFPIPKFTCLYCAKLEEVFNIKQEKFKVGLMEMLDLYLDSEKPEKQSKQTNS